MEPAFDFPDVITPSHLSRLISQQCQPACGFFATNIYKCNTKFIYNLSGVYLFLPLWSHFNPAEPVVEKSVIL